MAHGKDTSQLSHLNVLILGKTGSGKSSLANALTGTHNFEVSEDGLESVTHECQRVDVKLSGVKLTVVDTPGCMDTDSQEKALVEMCRAITLCQDGFDACLLVLRLDVRLTKEEKTAIDLLARLFGAEIFKHSIIVFTHGDKYEGHEKEFERYIERVKSHDNFLKDFLDCCTNRKILVNCGEQRDEASLQEEIDHLLNMIVNLSKSRKKFTTEHFQFARQHFKDMVGKYDEHDDAVHAAAIKLAEQMKKSGDGCFPADAVVQTPEGPVTMSELSVGQSVLCVHNGRPIYSPVYMWGHRDDSSCSSSYVTVTTESAAHMTLSSDHLLIVIDEMGDEVSVAAGDVCPGLTVQVLHHHMPSCQEAELQNCVIKCEKVVSVERCVTRSGLFAPFTLCGNLMVDGVLASCYIRCLPHSLSHALLWPVRFAWQLAPSAVNACNRVGDGGMPWWVGVIESRVLHRLGWLAVGAGGGDASVKMKRSF